jgi:hypothetical protein
VDDMLRMTRKKSVEQKHLYAIIRRTPEWIEERQKDKSLNIKTVNRDDEHWNKYYKEYSIIHVPISRLITKMLNDFFNVTITKFNLSNREYNNMKSVCIRKIEINSLT